MAEIAQTQRTDGGGVRSKKLSTHIDMTPMVDLAFLLLTFFILTTSLTDKHVLELPMPDGPPSPVNEKNILNIVPAEGNKLYWWPGLAGAIKETDYSRLRRLLLEATKANPNLMVLVKPMDRSRYENIIDVLDELTITRTQRYAIVDFTDEDAKIIAGN